MWNNVKTTCYNAKTALEYAILFLFFFWIIQFIQILLDTNLRFLGILPHSKQGLIGIITSPFIHGSIQHLMANSLPFSVLCFLFFFFYKRTAWKMFIVIWLTSGLITWLIGRQAWHIGASSIIYALASFLFFGGIMSHKFLLIVLAAGVLFAYSGLVWGMFPTEEHISWEGHLSGAISGFIWAFLCRKSLRVKTKLYRKV